MKNYNYLTKKEIDELITEYEEEKKLLLNIVRSMTNDLICRRSEGRDKPAN